MVTLTRNGLKKFIGMKTFNIIFPYLEYVVLWGMHKVIAFELVNQILTC